MSDTPVEQTPTAPEAPKATRSNPGKKAEPKAEGGPKITKLPCGTVKEDY